MVNRFASRWVLVGLFAAGALQIGVASAQTPQGSTANGRGVEIGSERTAVLSPAQQLQRSRQVIDMISGIRRRVSDMLDRARQERDIIKANCLDDKLTQIDVTLRSAREHNDLLQTAVETNNDGQRNHEFSLITIFRQRVESLDAEARQCVGEEASGFGRGTTLTVQVNPNIPQRDNAYYPADTYTPERPLTTSPVM